jgi:hypothetical protein
VVVAGTDARETALNSALSVLSRHPDETEDAGHSYAVWLYLSRIQTCARREWVSGTRARPPIEPPELSRRFVWPGTSRVK